MVLISGCWIEISDVHGLGGISHTSTTLEECKAACINNNTCVAIDWEPSNAEWSCWILTSIYILPTTQTGVITHYQLDRACLS